MGTLLCCNLQDKKIAKLQVARCEYCKVGSLKIGGIVSSKGQNRSIANLQIPR